MDYCEPGLIREALLKDLLSPPPRKLMHIEAEVLIVQGQYILHYRDSHGQDQFKFLSEESMRLAFSEQEVDSGNLPPNTIRWGSNAKGTWLLQWIPPGRHTILLEGEAMPQNPVSVPLPGIIFGGIGTSYYVWAVKEKLYAPHLPLYHAPLPNIGLDGKVCFGQNHPGKACPETFEQTWQLFISSPFNGDLVAGKSARHAQDIREQLCRVKKKPAYPISDLRPLKQYAHEDQLTITTAIGRYFLQKNFA